MTDTTQLEIVWRCIDGTRDHAAYWTIPQPDASKTLVLLGRLEELPPTVQRIEVQGQLLYRWQPAHPQRRPNRRPD